MAAPYGVWRASIRSVAATRFGFVNAVVADRDLVVTGSYDHACRLEPRESDLAWYCDLDDGTPTDSDRDPAAHVRWLCPELRVSRSSTVPAAPMLEVSRPGPHSDFGRLMQGLARFAGRTPPRKPDGDTDGRFAYTDPAGILDVDLRRRIENWPLADDGDGVVRPAELWSIKATGEGLVVTSVSWWDSAPALDHQLGLAIDIAHRLTAQR
jgi:hypothetical protein